MSKKKENTAPMEEEQAEQSAGTEEAAVGETQEQEETFSVTREQMEKMEQLAGQLAALNDKHLRLAAEYDNYRKRTTWRSMTTWSGPCSRREMRTMSTKRAWR